MKLAKRNLEVGMIALLASSILVLTACTTTEKSLNEEAKKRGPGNPAYNWVNGKWTGADDRFYKAYWMRVVDGNKIVGKEESCSHNSGACSGRVPLWGEVIDSTTLDITYDKRAVPGVGQVFHQILIRSGDSALTGPGFELKKVK